MRRHSPAIRAPEFEKLCVTFHGSGDGWHKLAPRNRMETKTREHVVWGAGGVLNMTQVIYVSKGPPDGLRNPGMRCGPFFSPLRAGAPPGKSRTISIAGVPGPGPSRQTAVF